MPDLSTRCDVCGALIDEEDLFCANCGKEAPHREQPAAAHQTHGLTHNFQCDGCGASMSYDASAQSLRCPFCGSESLKRRAGTRVLKPSRVVPFRLTREQAVAQLRKSLGRGFWRPSDLSQQAAIVKMAAVYVPYWIFEAKTHTYWTSDTDQLPWSARGDWRPLFGEHRGRYAGLLVGASGALTSRETSELCPYDLAAGEPPEKVDLENVTVEQFQVMRKYARPLARQGLQRLEGRECEKRYVPGRCRNMKVNTRIEDLSSEPMLLPVWMMAYRYKDQPYRYLINGQTGQATGAAPTSWRKILVAIAIALAAAAAMLALIAALGR